MFCSSFNEPKCNRVIDCLHSLSLSVKNWRFRKSASYMGWLNKTPGTRLQVAQSKKQTSREYLGSIVERLLWYVDMLWLLWAWISIFSWNTIDFPAWSLLSTAEVITRAEFDDVSSIKVTQENDYKNSATVLRFASKHLWRCKKALPHNLKIYQY